MAALGHEDISRLDVTMNDTFAMCRVQRIGNLNCQTEQDIGFEGLSCYLMFQRHPVQKFHCDESQRLLLANVINCADIGMIQCRCGLSFALKAR